VKDDSQNKEGKEETRGKRRSLNWKRDRRGDAGEEQTEGIGGFSFREDEKESVRGCFLRVEILGLEWLDSSLQNS
jgi:hypothetical protein